jgi:alpha-tubulin suppressor-like RCC1 family protein
VIDGSLYAIGWNRYGQCGHDPQSSPCVSHSPVRLQLQTEIIDCAAGDRHSLVLDALGDVYAFGSNEYGQLGCGNWKIASTSPSFYFIPQRLKFESHSMGDDGVMGTWYYSKVRQLEAAAHQSFVLFETGDVFFFGWGGYFQLGSRNSDDYFLPTKLNSDFLSCETNDSQKSLELISRISSGSWHTLFLTTEGALYSVGWSKWGQLGLGMSDASVMKPTKISYFSEKGVKIVSCASGSSHSLALDDKGIVYWYLFCFV